MNNLDTTLKRILTNVLFGTGVLLILLLAVVFCYYIDKQRPSAKHKQHIEQTINIE